jgi:peptidase M28-like protein/PDZ domain-containing protein/PA domain-containing protein
MRRIGLYGSLAAATLASLLAATVTVSSRAASPSPSNVLTATTAHAQAETRLLDEIKYLASDELEGRGIGTAGLNKAADFMRRQFEESDLDVTRVHGSAFQTFSMSTDAKLGSPNSLHFLGPDGKTIVLKQDVDFRPCSFGGGGKIEGELAFAGYAIDSSANHYQDFKGIDVKGKVVIVMRRVPRQKDPHGPFNGPHGDVSHDADLRSKVSNATAAGARAILVVNDPLAVQTNIKESQAMVRKAADRVIEAAEAFEATDTKAAAAAQTRKALSTAVGRLKAARAQVTHGDNDPLMTFGYGGNGKAGNVPVLQLTVAACDRLLKPGLGKTLEELETQIDRDLKPHSAVLAGWKAEGVTTISRVPVEVKNVIGVLEGEGPLAEETIVVGAHYDHLGRGGPGSGSLLESSHEIHNGADDNASGSAALIELARHFAHQPKKLPRRLVFIAFTGEEEGLFGSAHYVKDPLFPLEKTVAMINLDMVGRLREAKLTVFGIATSNHWKDLVDRATQAHHLHLIPKPEGFGPSDHSSFYAKKIPVLFFFTGSHSDYHRPTDDWQKINIPGEEQVIDVVEDVVAAIAQAPQRPAYVEVKEQGAISRGGSRPYFGSIPDFSSEGEGYSISGVAPGSPADLAGVKGGDRLIQLGERKISGLDDFDLALRKFAPGDEVPAVVLRAGKTVRLKVVLGKPK